MSRNKFLNILKFDVEKFYGKINYGLWQVQVKDELIQSELHKALKGKDSVKEFEIDYEKSNMSDEDWKYLDVIVASTIHIFFYKKMFLQMC